MSSFANTSLIVEITVGDFFPANPFNADLSENIIIINGQPTDKVS